MSLRSYEDRWLWLRGQLEDDVAILDAKSDGDTSGYLFGKGAGVWHALDLMDTADRNGPVEPL